MKVKCFAVIIAVFALYGVAAAQDYAIRAESRNNLRSCAGFDCRVVETVPVGTVLQVTGEFNRWLKISRNGAEVWMANWVDYSRVEPGEQASSPPASSVDNCCFVDRQCNTDAEWSSGFWAYQNNQCAAPSQSQPPASSQPASIDPSQIDNCCFLDWQCNTDDDWLTGFHAFQNNSCKHPEVTIEGSADFIARVEAALDMLKDRAPEWYAYAVSGPDKYKESQNVGTLERTFNITRGHAFAEPLAWLVGVIVHDSCHINRFVAGLLRYESEAEQLYEERLCLQIQIEALEAMNLRGRDNQDMMAYLRDTLENIDNLEYQWWH